MRSLYNIVFFISMTRTTGIAYSFVSTQSSSHPNNFCSIRFNSRKSSGRIRGNSSHADFKPNASERIKSGGRIRCGHEIKMMASRLPPSPTSLTNIGTFGIKRNRQSTKNNLRHTNNEPTVQKFRKSNKFLSFNTMNSKKIKKNSKRSSLSAAKVSNDEVDFSKSNSSYQLGLASIPLTEIITKLIAFAIPISVLLTLAMKNNDPTAELMLSSSTVTAAEAAATREIDFVLYEIEENIEKLETLTSNILDAALPQDATDLFSIALGESIAGLLGALATYGLNMSLMGGKAMMANGSNKSSTSAKNKNVNSSSKRSTSNENESKNANARIKNASSDTAEMDNYITEAVADGDYFLTRAVATPLIGSVGVSGGMASALTVLLASVPYEFIKQNARVKERRQKREDMYMDALLKEELKRKKKWFGLGGWMVKNEKRIKKNQSMKMVNVDSVMKKDKNMMKENEEDRMEMKYQFDSIELFADVCKWLEYDVLLTDFGGQLKWFSSGIPIEAGWESAVFGGLAALSSQIYADIIYTFSDSMGSLSKREEVRSRTLNEFFNLYSIKIISAATLFGVYETARLPITQVVINFLSGGYEGCVGSADFDLCLETYFFSNPAEATPEAQFRSFAVAFMDLFDRLTGDISNENVDVAGVVRSLTVQLYSIIGFDLPPLIQ